MRLLLDTHCWLWYLLTPQRLNAQVHDLLRDPDHEIYLSAASAWEIVIKFALGKLELPTSPVAYIPSRLATLGHNTLPIRLVHTLQLEQLPPHHKDPFDRILVAQAQVEEMQLVTADRVLTAYDVSILWAGLESLQEDRP